jgi:hypothetical protein
LLIDIHDAVKSVDGGNMILQNVGNDQADDMAAYPRTP